MADKKGIILLTNDDGIHSQGWKTFYRRLSEEWDVCVVVPEYEQSGKSVSITLNEPLRVRRQDDTIFSTNGTPADCINLGVHLVLAGKTPDIIVSGINKGLNIGGDVLYSGTMGAAIEGSLLGILSVACSLEYKRGGEYADFDKASVFTQDLLRHLVPRLPADIRLLNLNLPFDAERYSLENVRVTQLGRRSYKDLIMRRLDPRKRPYYWYSGEKIHWQADEEADYTAIKQGYVSLTPIKLLATDKGAKKALHRCLRID